MDRKKIYKITAVCLILTAMAAPGLTKGGRGGGSFGGRPSFSRQAVSRPAQQAPRPQQNRTAEAPERTETKRDIDQGIDPKDYGKRNTGSTAAGTGTAQNSGAVKNNFSGGTGGFFSGFSLWPWLWFSGHSTAAASDGDKAEAEETESFSAMLGRWYDSVISFFKTLLGF